jgi:methionyl-tRNA formyltransferase
MNIVFFGSTSDSVIVLSRLVDSKYSPVVVVTQPPKPTGRKQDVTPTPVETWANEHTVPVCSFSNRKNKPWMYEHEENVINTLSTFKPDLLISACYGQKIPDAIITNATYGGMNIHPSFLPRWRGADPVPWAILTGDRQTGVTIVSLSAKFDRGAILAREKIPITTKDVADSLRTKLFTIGADLLLKTLPDILSGSIKGTPQQSKNSPYARRLTRDDGFEPWDRIQKAFTDAVESARIDRKFRALTPWPGVWTLLRQGFGGQALTEKKRLKILEAHVENGKLILDTVQLEGKNPVSWNQFEKAYL